MEEENSTDGTGHRKSSSDSRGHRRTSSDSDFLDLEDIAMEVEDGATWADDMAEVKDKHCEQTEIATIKKEDDNADDWDNSSDWDETMESLKSKIREEESHFRDVEADMLHNLEDMDDLMAIMDTSLAKDLVPMDSVNTDHHHHADPVKSKEATPQKQGNTAANLNNAPHSHSGVPDEEERRARNSRFRRFGPFQDCLDYLFSSCKCVKC